MHIPIEFLLIHFLVHPANAYGRLSGAEDDISHYGRSSLAMQKTLFCMARGYVL